VIKKKEKKRTYGQPSARKGNTVPRASALRGLPEKKAYLVTKKKVSIVQKLWQPAPETKALSPSRGGGDGKDADSTISVAYWKKKGRKQRPRRVEREKEGISTAAHVYQISRRRKGLF